MRRTSVLAAGLLLLAALALAVAPATPSDPTMLEVDDSDWPGTHDRGADPPGYPPPDVDDGGADEPPEILQAAASTGNCPNNYHDPRYGPRHRCWCKAGWAPFVSGWTKNKNYPTRPPTTCKNLWFDWRRDKVYDPKAAYPSGRGPCACFPCPPSYSSFGMQHLNASLGGCQRVYNFYVQFNLRTKGKVCNDQVWKAVRIPLLNVTRSTPGFLNVRAPSNVVTNASAANRYYSRAYKVFCKETFDPPFVKGVRKYSVAFRYAYIGKPDVANKMVAKVQKILPLAAKAKAQTASDVVEPAATNCAYGLCSVVITSSNGLDAMESISAQLAPFDVPVDPQLLCTPPACDDRGCNKGTCLPQYGQCDYSPLPDGTTCSAGSVLGTCQAGTCSGMSASIKQAVIGQTENVVFTVQFPLPLDALGGKQAYVYSSSAGGGIEARQWGELFDDGDPAHFDALAGDGIFSNVMPVTFTQQGAAYFAGVLLGETISPLPQTSINVIRSADVPTYDTMARLQQALRALQRFVDAQTSIGTSKSVAIDKLVDIIMQGGTDGIDTSFINMDSITRISDRGVSFTMQPGSLPAVILTTSTDETRTCQDFPGARRRLLSAGDESSGSDAGNSRASTGLFAHPWTPGYSTARRSLHQQACPYAKGMVVVLAPYFTNFKCSGHEESDKVAELFRKAGYDVVFKCNSPAHCPAGPPTMEDFTKLSGAAAVFVSTVGHSGDTGGDPLLLTRASLPLVATNLLNSRFAADWANGRAVMVGSGGFALTPGWFQKHGAAAPGVSHAGTVLHFAADRSARGGAAQGFANAIRSGVPQSVSVSGYTDWLSRDFAPASPATRMAEYLLARNSDVDNLPSLGTVDTETGALFNATTFESGAELRDKCDYVCRAASCTPTICPNGGLQGGCNSLSGTCDTSCCDKADGDACTLRGLPSTCAEGRCQDVCPAAICSNSACKTVTAPGMTLCDPQSGSCPTQNVPDGTLCQYYGTRQGACTSGVCSDVCKNVRCNPAPCQTGTCNPTSGECEYASRPDGSDCPLAGLEETGTCRGGTCLPFSARCVNYVPLTGVNQFIWGDGRGGTPMFSTPPAVVSDCLPDGLSLGIYPRAAPCESTTDLLVTGKGMYFMRCFTYSIDGSTNVAALGPAVELEPLEAYNGREIRLMAIQLGAVNNEVDDCQPDFSVTFTNSAANVTMPLPCWMSTSTVYELPGAGVPIPLGERTLLQFIRMSPQHIFAVRRLYYIIV